MEKPVVINLKQKLKTSRLIYNDITNDHFLRVLYKILDNPTYRDVLSWSDNGKLVVIKNNSRVESEVLPLFEACPTMLAFYRKIENCGFAQGFDWDHQDMTVFEHLTYNRDKRPVLDRRFTKKYLFASQSDESGELRDQIRKLQKRVPSEEIAEEFVWQPQPQIDQQTRAFMSEIPLLLSDIRMAMQIKQLKDTLNLGEKLLNIERN